MDVVEQLRDIKRRLESVERRRERVSQTKASAYVPYNTTIAAGQYWATDVLAPTGYEFGNCLVQTSLIYWSGTTAGGPQAATNPLSMTPTPLWWPNTWTVRVGVYCHNAVTFGSGWCRVDVLFTKL